MSTETKTTITLVSDDEMNRFQPVRIHKNDSQLSFN
jgi:hypothetical protein